MYFELLDKIPAVHGSPEPVGVNGRVWEVARKFAHTGLGTALDPITLAKCSLL